MHPYLKILLGVVGAVIVGLLLWRFVGSKPPATTGTTQGGYYSGTQTNVTPPGSNTSTSSGQSQQVQPTNLQFAYDTLYTQILAKKVAFQQVTSSSTGDLKAIYANYAADISSQNKAYPSQAPFSLSVAMVDLTDDGINEALVYENLPDFCGPGGCEFDIYQKKNATWMKIYSNDVAGSIGLSNVLTNGYLDLFLSAAGAPTVDRYIWDGKKYDYKETMAIWTGTSFIVRQ